LSIFLFVPRNIISISFFDKEYYGQSLTNNGKTDGDDGFKGTRDVETMKTAAAKYLLHKDGVGKIRRSLYYDHIADFNAYNSTLHHCPPHVGRAHMYDVSLFRKNSPHASLLQHSSNL
jgi:hypothetical protein